MPRAPRNLDPALLSDRKMVSADLAKRHIEINENEGKHHLLLFELLLVLSNGEDHVYC